MLSPKKVMIKSLVVIFPHKKVSIIRYSLLVHIKSKKIISLIAIFPIPNMSIKHWVLQLPIQNKNLEQTIG